MDVLLYDDSGQITQRLIDLINETTIPLTFYPAITISELKALHKEVRPAIIILRLKYASKSAEDLINSIAMETSHSGLLVMCDLTDENETGLFNIPYEVKILDTYKDFEKIPGLIRQEIEKNQSAD